MGQLITKTHYSATELAAMKLPGLPETERGIRSAATREEWASRQKVKGKGNEYAITSLPREAQEHIRRSTAQAVLEGPRSKVAMPRREEQLSLIETEAQALKADARKGVLQALELLMQRSGYPMKKAAAVLIDMARIGSANPQLIAMLKMARDERGRKSPDGLPSVRSVLRFVEYERTGMLAPKKRERDMRVPAWAPFFLGYYQRPEKPTVEHAYREFCKDWAQAQAGAEVPSVHQVRRFLQKVGNVSREIGRMGERELKTLKPFIRRGFESLLPGDIYSADGHTFDSEVQHPLHGRPFRPEITTLVDIATRKAVGWSVGLAESALAVLDALRDACLRDGIPAVFYVDNGSGYKNEMMLDVATGFMSRLGIEMVNSLPYNSQARGVIERLHQTIWINAAKSLPGYIGHDMDREAKLSTFKLSRKAIAQAGKPGEVSTMPLMAWQQFVALCEAKVAEYNDRPHRSLPKIADPVTGRRRHMTPNEKWALHVAQGFEAHRVTDDEARPLFRPQMLRTVRRCEIELLGNRYFAKALEEYHGEQLRVGYDIHDPHLVWVYDDEGRFLCTAELDANKRDYMPKSLLDRAREKRAVGREKRLEAKLVEVREELHGTPVLEHVDTVTIPGFMNLSRAQLAQRARELEVVEVAPAMVEPAAQEAMPTPIDETPAWAVPATPEARWAEWQRLNTMDEMVIDSEKAKKWRHTYQATAEFRTYQRKSA
ncbi:Mu transposase C-terminal domain-containing protein [Laribacter hongkongensis]|uniref:Mu transposase C-terminal domain-containing protein n=2 Tax=Laribacter hongkongensis TaxID=168471 RepID=UPI001EFEB9AB|nr:Mu transposase C-terminal domain-containing protein [Laribacter hongkongensis]MCG8993248.1 Mu transposase C-terminal domain-containing protein [Laribacter hongkongensis]MCG9002356.1 Mu transposase C-terminal domain-containing protein [Laribacter hongkongensis]MCG9005666.1 Mu transposase C-terminal domain-containing protein [Laribacter hongkongensis]MCG9008803.1 Mu transposase C-terminal domain-containing protein [Laribacter hongkongensis]MCG9013062.1 Mu transposase C-terminal domain-contain